MKISLTSVPINHYDNALKFYTEILGFVKKEDVELGHGIRWITVVSPEDSDGPQLLLEPNSEYPAMKALSGLRCPPSASKLSSLSQAW